jgi:hypothetical protein
VSCGVKNSRCIKNVYPRTMRLVDRRLRGHHAVHAPQQKERQVYLTISTHKPAQMHRLAVHMTLAHNHDVTRRETAAFSTSSTSARAQPYDAGTNRQQAACTFAQPLGASHDHQTVTTPRQPPNNQMKSSTLPANVGTISSSSARGRP